MFVFSAMNMILETVSMAWANETLGKCVGGGMSFVPLAKLLLKQL